MEKSLTRKLAFFLVFWTMAGTRPATASEPCEKKLSAAFAALEARELQVEGYRKLSAEQATYISELKAQRGEAIELLKPQDRKWLTDEALFLLGMLAGVGAAYGISRLR